MPKNIIICCDGTGNQFGNANSNVVKTYGVLQKIPGEQVTYYDPGLGTSKYTGIGFSWSAFKNKLLGLMGGIGIYENVYEAYSYLMENYEEGDQVYLFGFSRGAYTVRVLSGFIAVMGLLERGGQNLIPYAFRIYAAKDYKTSNSFRAQFSRGCPIHFMGVWDTVSSVGYVWNLKQYPATANNLNVRIIRHAAAIDERRAFYTLNKIGTKYKDKQDIKEVWFSGVHSDVGGSYPENESGLAKISLQWMLNEAVEAGLKVNKEKYSKEVLGNNTSKRVGPDPDGMIHQSLTGMWKIFEYIPRYKIVDRKTKKREWFLPRGRYRTIPEGALLHQTVFQRTAPTLNRPPDNPKVHKVAPIRENIAP